VLLRSLSAGHWPCWWLVGQVARADEPVDSADDVIDFLCKRRAQPKIKVKSLTRQPRIGRFFLVTSIFLRFKDAQLISTVRSSNTQLWSLSKRRQTVNRIVGTWA
jgi:hypothetical protein